jgi:hypothetical protein
MSAPPLLNAAGRRRSPVTLLGYLAGRPPRNKGLRYPPDPPTVEEIVAVMRQAGDGPHGARMGALIVLLWRAGLRINEALRLTEHDLEPRAGSVLVRHGKGGRRREVGMDPWGWEQLRPWLELRIAMPVGPLPCVIDGPTRGRPWASDPARAQLRRDASKAGVRRRFAPHQLRHAHAVELAHEGSRSTSSSANWGTRTSASPPSISRDRQRRDHRYRPRAQGADDPRQHQTPHLSRSTAASLAVAPELLVVDKQHCAGPVSSHDCSARDKQGVGAEDGYRESTKSWVAVLRDFRDRGLNEPRLVIGDGTLGTWAALRDVFPAARKQTC